MPLNATARRARVGQGSLYRHFPDRRVLLAAVVEENVAALEHAVRRTATTLPDLLGLASRHAIESLAVIDQLASDSPARMLGLRERVREVLASRLDEALAAGHVPRARRPTI